jgi:hypothetical protein
MRQNSICKTESLRWNFRNELIKIKNKSKTSNYNLVASYNLILSIHSYDCICHGPGTCVSPTFYSFYLSSKHNIPNIISIFCFFVNGVTPKNAKVLQFRHMRPKMWQCVWVTYQVLTRPIQPFNQVLLKLLPQKSDKLQCWYYWFGGFRKYAVKMLQVARYT